MHGKKHGSPAKSARMCSAWWANRSAWSAVSIPCTTSKATSPRMFQENASITNWVRFLQNVFFAYMSFLFRVSNLASILSLLPLQAWLRAISLCNHQPCQARTFIFDHKQIKLRSQEPWQGFQTCSWEKTWLGYICNQYSLIYVYMYIYIYVCIDTFVEILINKCANTRAAMQLFFTARTWAKPHKFDSSVTLLLTLAK